jgi:hypothetical protein
MKRSLYSQMAMIVLALAVWTMPAVTIADTPASSQGHMRISGVVTGVKSGVVTVKTPAGHLTLNENAAHRHGKEPKIGDELTIYVNENNMVIDVHTKGQEGLHRLITGKLIYVGKMKNEIKLWTPEGEKVFPLERIEVKTGPLPEGTLITVEVNESGTVVDVHKAETKP